MLKTFMQNYKNAATDLQEIKKTGYTIRCVKGVGAVHEKCFIIDL